MKNLTRYPSSIGTLVGITNSLAAIPGFIAPIVVGVLTKNNVSLTAAFHLSVSIMNVRLIVANRFCLALDF
jgi:hypothetical protein